MTQRSVVLCYHAISDTWEHLLSVPSRGFERQLRLMLALRYVTGSATDVLERRITELSAELSRLNLPWDEWQIVYRLLLQVDRALHGDDPLPSPAETRTMGWRSLASAGSTHESRPSPFSTTRSAASMRWRVLTES